MPFKVSRHNLRKVSKTLILLWAWEMFYLNLLLGKIHNPFHFVRDFYFFKRSQYPQLCLVHKKPEEAAQELQVSELILWPVLGLSITLWQELYESLFHKSVFEWICQNQREFIYICILVDREGSFDFCNICLRLKPWNSSLWRLGRWC